MRYFVAIDSMNKRILLAEVKRNPEKIQIEQLKQKANNLLTNFENYEAQYVAFSLAQLTEAI